MKNLIAFAICQMFVITGAAAIVNWWERPTICQLSETSCYPEIQSPFVGLDVDEWDGAANCKGKKLICPNAILPYDSASVALPFSRAELADNSLINPDFDITVLGFVGDCFGTRRTRNNGSSARVMNNWVNVWCSGILNNADEELPSGEIVLKQSDQPSCASLAEDGYIGIIRELPKSGKQCFGMFGFPTSDFFLECRGNNLLPGRIVVLNGADDYRTSSNPYPQASIYPITEEIAAARFSKMIENSAAKRRQNAAAAMNNAEPDD